MKKIIILLSVMIFAVNIQAETIKIDKKCVQHNDFVLIHVPIKLEYKNQKVSYHKLLSFYCNNNLCNGLIMNTVINKKGFSANDIVQINDLKRIVNRVGYVVFEWGINVFSVDFVNNKVNWIENGISTEGGRGEEIVNCNFISGVKK